MSIAPLLRSPPFPWVAADVAAVSGPGKGDVDPDRLAALVASIREARIGGSFWASPGTAQGGLLAHPRSDDEWTAIALIAGAELIGVDRTAVEARLADRLLGGVAYRDPFSGNSATAERVIEILADWRAQLDANRGIAVATGISWWKKKAIGQFLWCDRQPSLTFAETAVEAIAASASIGAIATWPAKAPEGLAAAAATADIPVVSIEDGFIRSVGLGSDLHPPSSIVVDAGGIYYDPSQPSDLETILATASFPPTLLDRAAELRAAIMKGGVSKYASDAKAGSRVRHRGGRRTVLVAGQVEDDMSVRAAGGAVAGNLDLLRRARTAEPNAHILFKPHPDVDAGHRVGRVPDAELKRYADTIVRGGSMAALLAEVDAVHVLTSLTGFEALIRGVETIVHGHPFYAGWGLTEDLAGSLPRRTRTLTIDELTAGTLILYPRYLDPRTQLPCPPEVLLQRFAAQGRQRRSPLILARQIQGRLARLFGTVTD